MKGHYKRKPAPRAPINDNIRAQELRVIDEKGSQLGILSKSDALVKARDAELDLVVVSPNASPPVAKIIDWGKHHYEQTKKNAKQKKSGGGIKQMRFGIKIGEHDMDIKIKRIRKFLEQGNLVRISVVFRGREMAHKELGNSLIDKIMQKLENEAIIDGKPVFAGRFLSVNIRPAKK